MRSVTFLFALGIASVGAGLVPTFKIDLNRKPFDRWEAVGKKYGSKIQALINLGLDNRFPKYVLDSIGIISRELELYMSQPYLDEVKGLSAYGNISLSGLVFIQLLYEATAYCTSIVCVTDSGVIWHARNLDYGMTGAEVKYLKELSLNVDFVKDGKSVYKGTTFGGLVGLPTGLKPNGFSVTLNQRDKGSLINNLFSLLREIFSSGTFSSVFTQIRTVLDEAKDFRTAVAQLTTARVIAPCYLIVGGVRNDEGVVITRDQTSAIDIQRLNSTGGRWFLLETNYDNWVPPPPDDDRRDPGIRAMRAMTRAGISVQNLFKVLWTPPVRNNGTIYSTVMSARGYNMTSIVPAL